MKRRLGFLWVLLAAAVVFAGWFLPGFILTRTGTPNFTMDYQTVEVSSQSSTDYFWRLETEARQQMYERGGGDLRDGNLSETFINDRYSEEEQGILLAQVLREFQKLVDDNVFPSTVLDVMRQADGSVEVMYLFDAETLRGFSFARFYFNLKIGKTYQIVTVYSDLSSGKIYALRCYGFPQELIQKGYRDVQWFWHDQMRGFADYLGLGADTTVNLTGESAPEINHYEDQYTVDLLGVESPSSDGWFELRTVQEGDSFALLLYRSGT